MMEWKKGVKWKMKQGGGWRGVWSARKPWRVVWQGGGWKMKQGGEWKKGVECEMKEVVSVTWKDCG